MAPLFNVKFPVKKIPLASHSDLFNIDMNGTVETVLNQYFVFDRRT